MYVTIELHYPEGKKSLQSLENVTAGFDERSHSFEQAFSLSKDVSFRAIHFFNRL